MDSQIKEQVIKYLQLGFIPIPLRGKVARYHWKNYRFNPQDFTKPGTNVGIRTTLLPSGDYFYVVDLDTKDSLATFYEAHPTLIGAPLISTGKGWHIYLTWKKEPKTRHFKGTDIIANGYVLCPPSIHPNGHVYKFIIPLKGLPPCYNPEWLSMENSPYPLIIINSRRNEAEYPVVHGHMPENVSQGQRHSTLVRYLGVLISRHFSEQEALAQVIEWNRRNHPPLSIKEVKSTVRSCWAEWDVYRG